MTCGQQFANVRNITHSVLQGSVFGPVLFFIYINDLPNGCNSDFILFSADITTITRESNLEQLNN
jgi:hypothetical protein